MRLTEKAEDGYVFNQKANKKSDEYFSNVHRMMDKLGSLEDVDDMCQKIRKKAIFRKIGTKGDGMYAIIRCDYTSKFVSYDFLERAIVVTDTEVLASLFLDEYGKTWAFTKEELS